MAMLGALGDLVLSLSADTAKFSSDLGRAQRLGDKFGREMGRMAGNLAGAFVALAGSAGFTALIKGQIDAADEAGKMAQKVGIAVEQLSAYQVAAKLADVSNEQLQTGFQQLAKNQADYVAGTGEAADAFRALGISQEQVKALNGDNAKLFELVAGKLASFEDGANKTAIAMKIFGKSGAELIPMINGLEETRKEAEELGRVIDKDTAAAAERFNDNLTRTGIAVQAVGLSIAKVVLPTLEKLSENLVKAAKDTEGMERAGRIADSGLKILASGATIVSTVFSVLGKTLASTFGALEAAGHGRVREAFNILRDGITDTASEVARSLDSLKKTWDSVPEAITDAADNVYNSAPDNAKKLSAPALQAEEQVKKAAAGMRAAIMSVHDDAMNAALADIEIAKRQQEEIAKLAEARVSSGLEFAEEHEKKQFWINKVKESQRDLTRQVGESERAASRFNFTFNSALEDALVRMESLSNVWRAFVEDVARFAIRQTITEPLGNAVSGMVGKGMSGLRGLFSGSPFSGAEEAAMLGIPAFAEGTDFVPRTGLAMVHRGEAIIPAGESLGGITVVNHYSIDARSDQASIAAMLERTRRATISDIKQLQDRRGDARL